MKLFFTLVLVSSIQFIAFAQQPDVEDQPQNFPTVCQPNGPISPTNTQSFNLNNNGKCSNGGSYLFVWQYNNGGTWQNVTGGTPVGFTSYSSTSITSGNGSKVKGSSSLTVTLASNAATGTFSFRCIATYSGCSGNPVTSNPISLTVNPKPTPSFTTQPGATTCVGAAVTYTTQTGQSGYSWGFPGTLNTDYSIVSGGSSTDNTVTLRWLKAATNTVTINYTNPSTNCTAANPTSSNAIAVSALPAVSFITPPTGTICSNTDVTYTTQGSQSNYLWSIPGTAGTDYTITAGGIGTTNSFVTLKWLTAGLKSVSVNYTNAGGCTAATAATTSATITARPVPSFSTAPAASVCAETDVTYTTQSGAGTTYVWSVPGTAGTDYTITSGSLASSSNNVVLKWLTSGAKTVTVNYTLNSCAGLLAATSSTNVKARPNVTFSAAPGANSCSNTDVVYTTQTGQSNYLWTVEGSAGTDYTITAGGTGTSNNTVTIKWLTTGSNRTVTVNYTDAGTCQAITAASSTTFINPRPSPTFSTSADPITCLGAAVTYTTQASQTNYTWFLPGTAGTDYTILSGGVGTSNNTVTLKWLTGGTKSVSVNYTNANSCVGVSAASSTTSINIPVASTITPGSSTTFCDGGSVVLTSSAATSYQWYKDGSMLTGFTSNTYTSSLQGLYTVQTLNAAGCDAISSSTAVTVNPLPEILTATDAATLCFSAVNQTSTLSYSGILNNPTTYSINWNAAATGAGFTGFSNASLLPGSVDIPVPGGAPANIYSGTATVRNANGCISAPVSFNVRITTPPDISSFNVSAANGCQGTGSSITITSSSLVDGTYTITYNLTGANTVSGVTSAIVFSSGTGTFTAAALNAGSTDIEITNIGFVGCSATPAVNTTTFIINTLPSVAAISGANGVCILNSTTLSNTTPGGSWSTSDPFIATVNTGGLLNGLNVGSADISYTTLPDANSCVNSVTKTITVNPLPVITAIAGSTTLCINTTSNLTNATTGGTWFSSNTAVATINASGVVAGVAPGTSTITYSLPADVNGCTNSTSVLVTIETAPTANSGATMVTCQSSSPSSILLNDVSVGGSASTGAWSIITGGGSLSSNLQTTTPAAVTYTPAANFTGSVTLLLTTNAPGSCASVTATKTITVSQLPTVNAGPTATVCQSSTPSALSLAGATLGGGSVTGAWSITAGSGTLSDLSQVSAPAAVTFTPGVDFSGTVTLKLTTNVSGGCAAVNATKNITVTASPTVNPGSALSACKGSAALTLAGASIGGGASSGAWAISSAGGGILSNTSQTASPATITYTPAASFTGTITLTLTSDAPSGCAALSLTRSVIISNPATVNAGLAAFTCQSSSPTAITLSGASVSGGATTGAWSIISGGGTLSDITQTASPATVTYTPAVNYTGSVTLRLTSDVPAGCSAVTADKIITVSPSPTAVAGTTVITCSNNAQTPSGLAQVDITAGVSASNYTSVSWSSSGTGTFTNPTSLTTATYTPSVADKTAGSVILTLTAFGTSPCGNATSTKTLTITPAINEGTTNSWTQQPICSGQGVQFTLPGVPTGGNGTFAYQWMRKNNCGVAGVSTPVPGATSLSYIPTTSDCYWLFVSSGGCAVPQNLVGGTTRQNVDPTVAATSNISFGAGGNNPQICIGGNTVITAQSAVPYTYAWSPSTGLSSTTGATVTANPAGTTVYTVTATSIADPTCSRTATVTVTVSPLTVGGSLPSFASLCATGNTTVNLTGNTGTVTQWESSINGGGSWTPIANTTTAITFAVAAQTTLYRALVQSGACSSAYSTVALAGLHNVWTGRFNTDWQTRGNWSDSLLPDLTCDDVLIQNVTNKPVLSAGTSTIKNLVIQSSAGLTINNTGLLQIAGTITSNNATNTFDVTNGTIELNGTSGQTIPANVFSTNTIKDLIISNGVSLGGALDLTGNLSFGSTGKTFATGVNLTLKSSATNTAAVGQVIGGNSITGAVTVERYFSAKRAWRYLSVPTSTSQKISEAWQEGMAQGSTTPTAPAGYGTQVTDAIAPTAGNGFDYFSPAGPSVKKYDAASNTYTGIAATSVPIATTEGWMTFVRGDRTAAGLYATPTPTILRTKGSLFTGNQSAVMVPASPLFKGIGNPYAAPLDMRNIPEIITGVPNFFTVWDPNLTGFLGFGAFQTFTKIGSDYYPTPGSGSYPSSALPYNFIQSGQAFFVQGGSSSGSLSFTETAKASAANTNLVFRPTGIPESLLRTSLYALERNGEVALIDGTLNQFGDYDNKVDDFDARKMTNNAENLAIKVDSQLLVVERKHTISQQDTIFLNMQKMRAKAYRFEFNGQKFDTLLTAFLEDSYTNTRTAISINGTSSYDFTVEDIPGSWNQARFRIVFKSTRPQPITFTNITATKIYNDIAVDWGVERELAIKHYEVEKSTDGQNFTSTTTVNAKSNDNSKVNYQWVDAAAVNGDNFYRIKSTDIVGQIQYSNVVKVTLTRVAPQITVYPNPVVNDRIVVHLINQPTGTYQVRLFNAMGQLLFTNILQHGTSSAAETLQMKQWPHGNYHLEIIKPDRSKTDIKILY